MRYLGIDGFGNFFDKVNTLTRDAIIRTGRCPSRHTPVMLWGQFGS
jgi:hypothetical protein